MKKIAIFIVLFISCSTYNVKVEVKKSGISNLKQSGIIYRVPKAGIINIKDYNHDLTKWIMSYKKNNNLQILKGEKDLSYYEQIDRFLQLTPENDFMKFKTIGTITYYINTNEAKLKKLFADNKLDSLIIFEVDCMYSDEFLFVDFSSLMLIIDANLEIVYIDHQSDYYDDVNVDTGDRKKIHAYTINTISERFIDKLKSFGFIKKA